MGFIDAVFSAVIAIIGGAFALVGGLFYGLYRLGKGVFKALTGGSRKQIEGETVPEPEEPAGSRPARNVRVEPVDPDDYEKPKEAFKRKRPVYVHLDVDMGHDSVRIAQALAAYADDPLLGEHAQAAIGALQSADRLKSSYYAELDSTFEHGSMSWQKFEIPANAAFDTILRNSAMLGNRIQGFDADQYERLNALEADGKLANDPTRTQRLLVMRQKLAEIKQIQEGNEKLLLDLERLSLELSRLSGSGDSGESAALLTELEELVDQVKFYRE